MSTFTGFTGKTTVVDARIEYTGTYIASRKVRVTLDLYAKRIDWNGNSAATYYASTTSPSSWSEDYSMPTGTTSSVFKNYEELHLLTRTFTVTVNDNGIASVDMSFSVTATSSGEYTVTANVTSLSFGAPPYTDRKLYITTSPGVSITVKRTSSPAAGASTGELSNDATVYDKDVLSITYDADAGYSITDATLNGSPFSSGGTVTVSSNIDVSVVASLLSYVLSIVAGKGITVKVERTGTEAGIPVGELTDGSWVYHFDTLKITYVASSGYEATLHTINGTDFNSGDTCIVDGPVNIIVTSEVLGLVYIGGVAYQAFIGNGVSWDIYAPHVGEGPDKGFALCS